MSVCCGDNTTFFIDAVHSVLNQTRPPSEIIVSVDGPIPLSLEAALGEIEKHPLIRVVRIAENQGPGYARHAAILMTRHDVLAVMDSDDISLPTRFERQINYLLSNDLDVVGGFIEEFERVPGDLNKIRKVPLHHEHIVRFGKWRQPMNHVTIMFRRKAYMSVGGYHAYRSIEDYDLIYRLLVDGARFANIPQILVYARTGTSIMSRRSGLTYLRRELALIYRMSRDGFLSNSQWLFSSLFRIAFRLSPAFLLALVYRFLRK